jgi:D-xylose transport system substrate-binding protein
MTVYKAIVPEAETAAQMACDLAQGKPLSVSVNGKTANGTADIPSVLLTPVAVTKANVKDTVIKDNFWSKQEICTAEFASACTAAGL